MSENASWSSLSTAEDITVQDLYISGGSLKYSMPEGPYHLTDLDALPVYEKFRMGNFAAPSLRRIAESELVQITSRLRLLSVRISGGRDCAKNSGLFHGSIAVRASSGTLVRFENPTAIRGVVSGMDETYPGAVKVGSRVSDGTVILQAHTNYVIHGDDGDDGDDTPSASLLCYENSVIRNGDHVINYVNDIREGYEVIVDKGKCVRCMPFGALSCPRDDDVKVYRTAETCGVVLIRRMGDFRRSFRKVKRAVTLCRTLQQGVELRVLCQTTGLTKCEVLGTINRDYLGELGIRGAMTCILSVPPVEEAVDFLRPTSVSWEDLRLSLCASGGSEYCLRGSLRHLVTSSEGLYHLGDRGYELEPYDGTRAWGGNNRITDAEEQMGDVSVSGVVG